MDVSGKLLRIAKSRWHGAVVVQADMRFLPFKSEAFSAAVSMDTSFGYLPSEQDDLQSLKELRAALVTGGVLVVDVFNREQLLNRYKACSQLKRVEYPSFFLLQERSVDTDGSVLRDRWTVRDKTDGQVRVFKHVASLYTLSQLQGLLEQADFMVNRVLGDYEGQQFSFQSSRLILVAVAK